MLNVPLLRNYYCQDSRINGPLWVCSKKKRQETSKACSAAQQMTSARAATARKDLMARSISSVATRVLIEVNSTPADDAADWIAPHCPLAAGFAGSRST